MVTSKKNEQRKEQQQTLCTETVVVLSAEVYCGFYIVLMLTKPQQSLSMFSVFFLVLHDFNWRFFEVT